MAAQEKKKRSRKDTYVNLAAKGKKGNYEDLIDPLDYIIIGLLPDEGTMFGGVYPEGKMAEQIVKERFDGILNVTQIGVRLRVLRELLLVQQVKSLSGAKQVNWQKTEQGKAVFTEWQQHKGES